MTTLAALLALLCQDGIPPEKFDTLHRMIKPQAGEQRFWRIPWKLAISEAREEAARDGKPIFVWAGAGGAPIGVC
jgi:hypothetical protein